MRAKLKNARRDLGFTQQDMANMLGITLSYYQKIEGGARAGGIATWDRLEDITGINQRILRGD